jgi:hypothetical protein
MAGPDIGGGGAGALGYFRIAQQVIGGTLFGNNPKDRGFYLKNYDAAGNVTSRTRVGVRAWNAAQANQTNQFAPGRPLGVAGPVGPQIPVPRTPDAPPGYVSRPSTGYPAGYVPPASGAPPPKSPVDAMPPPKGMPRAFGNIWAQLVAYAVIWALPYLTKKAEESWGDYFKRWMDREAKHRAENSRRTPGGPGRKPPPPKKPPRSPDRPGVPTTPPGTGAPTIIINMPQAPTPRPAPAPKRPPRPDAGLSVPKIYRRYLPVPTVPTPAPTVSPWVKYGTLALPFVSPLLSALTNVGPGRRPKKYTDPLTPIQSTTANYFSTSSAPVYGSPPGKGKTCSCGPKKKRGPRKKRTICYKGSYTERANGITKRKRERVPCQA